MVKKKKWQTQTQYIYIYYEIERAAISRINNNCYTPPDRETSPSENEQVVPRHC